MQQLRDAWRSAGIFPLRSTGRMTSRERGKTALFTRASSSSWPTIDALTERGYQPLGLMTRMKAGENPSYDHAGCYYLDSWL